MQPIAVTRQDVDLMEYTRRSFDPARTAPALDCYAIGLSQGL